MNGVQYPERESEFEVQAELYFRLKGMGLDVRGCVKGRCRDFGQNPRVYLDLAIFDELKRLTIIIECKNMTLWQAGTELRLNKGRQERRYSSFGVPVILCPNIGAIEDVVQEILKQIDPQQTKG